MVCYAPLGGALIFGALVFGLARVQQWRFSRRYEASMADDRATEGWAPPRLMYALQAAYIELIPENGDGPSVRLRKIETSG